MTKGASQVPGPQTDILSELPRPTVVATSRRYRGLHLVTHASVASAKAAPADSFVHARRIVAQVEWEIQQQAARERRNRLGAWQAAGMQAALPSSFPRAVAMPVWMQAIDRICRFFGL
jgi:hypothetical protein